MKRVNESRKELAKLFKGQGAEIGVEQGVFSETICKQSPAVKLYCVDAWKTYREYRDHTRQVKLELFYEITKGRLSNYNCKLIRKLSLDAVKDFNDESLDFVYIDANHAYEYVLADIEAWSKKVKTGGIVSGHDYAMRDGAEKTYAVMKAVNDYVRKHKITNLTIYTGDDVPSWMFIKL